MGHCFRRCWCQHLPAVRQGRLRLRHSFAALIARAAWLERAALPDFLCGSGLTLGVALRLTRFVRSVVAHRYERLVEAHSDLLELGPARSGRPLPHSRKVAALRVSVGIALLCTLQSECSVLAVAAVGADRLLVNGLLYLSMPPCRAARLGTVSGQSAAAAEVCSRLLCTCGRRTFSRPSLGSCTLVARCIGAGLLMPSRSYAFMLVSGTRLTSFGAGRASERCRRPSGPLCFGSRWHNHRGARSSGICLSFGFRQPTRHIDVVRCCG